MKEESIEILRQRAVQPGDVPIETASLRQLPRNVEIDPEVDEDVGPFAPGPKRQPGEDEQKHAEVNRQRKTEAINRSLSVFQGNCFQIFRSHTEIFPCGRRPSSPFLIRDRADKRRSAWRSLTDMT